MVHLGLPIGINVVKIALAIAHFNRSGTECTKIARFSAAVAAIFAARPKNCARPQDARD